jgi:asparagine synthase (glutamine-hydrolysing)
VAERWLPQEVAWRRKHMFRAPMDSFNTQSVSAKDAWIEQVLSKESIEKAGYFDFAAVTAGRQRLAKMRRGLGRTGLEMGLTAVTATQLWHHLYISGDLASDFSGFKPQVARPELEATIRA